MENHEPAFSPEEKTTDHVAAPIGEPAAGDGLHEETGARPSESDVIPVTEGFDAPIGEAFVASANEATSAPDAEVTAAPKSLASSRQEGDASALAESAQPTHTEQPRKKVKVLSDRTGRTEAPATALADNLFDKPAESVVPFNPESKRRFNGVTYLYRLKDERRPGSSVIFYQSAYQQIVRHLSEDVSREHGGLLLGYESAGSGTDEIMVYVSKALPAQHTVGTPSRLTFTEDTWAEFANQTESLANTNLKRVGWYHSHPNFGIFLSPYDMDVCSNFQRQTHVALVYDPIRQEGGFFIRGTEGYDPLHPQGFWEYCDLTPASLVDWTNAELVLSGDINADHNEDADLKALNTASSAYEEDKMTTRNIAGAGGGPHAPRIRQLDAEGNRDRRGETPGAAQGRRTRRERLMTFLRGVLLGGALTALTAAVFLNTDVVRRYLSAPSLSVMLAEQRERDKQQDDKLDEIKRMLAGQSNTPTSQERGMPAGPTALGGGGEASGAPNEQLSEMGTSSTAGAARPGANAVVRPSTSIRDRSRARERNRPRRTAPSVPSGVPAGNTTVPAGTTDPKATNPAGTRPSRSPAGTATPLPTRSPGKGG